MELLIIDNHDSFVFNIVQLIGKLGAKYMVVSNEEAHLVDPDNFEKIIISPGPGTPLNSIDRGTIDQLLPKLKSQKILGVCFGHQLLGMKMGSGIYVMKEPMHGEVDTMVHGISPLYADVPERFMAVRYHSLALDPSSELQVDCVSDTDKAVMGFHSMDMHRFGVQFHPESLYSEYGERIISNFLEAC